MFGHVRHSFAAALGMTDIPSISWFSLGLRASRNLRPASRALAKL